MTTLADIAVGQRARVVEVNGADDIGIRLMEMGILPGVEVSLVGTAPLGDPLEFSVRGYRLSLRRNEARRIQIAGN